MDNDLTLKDKYKDVTLTVATKIYDMIRFRYFGIVLLRALGVYVFFQLGGSCLILDLHNKQLNLYTCAKFEIPTNFDWLIDPWLNFALITRLLLLLLYTPDGAGCFTSSRSLLLSAPIFMILVLNIAILGVP